MRSNLVRGALVGALLLVLVMAPGCSSGDDFPTTIAGDWEWTIAAFNCPILAGILDTLQTFTIVQVGSSIDSNGATISASFTDTNGNQVTITGTYVVDRMVATLDVLDQSNRSITAELNYFARDLGNDVRTLDGTIRITFDSDDTCTGQQVEGWLKSMTAPPAEIPGQQLIVADNNGDIWGLNQETGEETFLCNTFQVEGQEPGNLGQVSSMLYNTQENELWMGTGNGGSCNGCLFELNTTTGQASLINRTDYVALPGMARFSGAAYALNGRTPARVLSFDPVDADTINDQPIPAFNGSGGRGLTTTLGGTLYGTNDNMLYTIVPATGAATLVGPLLFNGFPTDFETGDARVKSMTTRQDGQVFAIVTDRFRDSSGGFRSFFARMDLQSREVTNVRQNDRDFDGIAIVPTGLFTKDCPLELVFLIDTTLPVSDIMALCAELLELEGIFNEAAMQGGIEGIPFTSDFRFEIYGITNSGNCMTTHLNLLFSNPTVPGTARTLNHPADWGDGSAVTAQRFNWSDTDNPFRVVIPLTYSSPQDGEMMCDTADDDSAGNLILQALLNEVFVLPVLLPEADQCVIDLATQIIEGTAPSLQNLAEFLQGDFEPLILERGDGGFDNLSSEVGEGIFILWAVNCGLLDPADFFGE